MGTDRGDRDAAATQYNSDAAAVEAVAARPEARDEIVWLQPETAPTAAGRSLDHYDCDAKYCVARDQHHAPLHAVENEMDSTSLADSEIRSLQLQDVLVAIGIAPVGRVLTVGGQEHLQLVCLAVLQQ